MNKRILIVDDNDNNLAILQDLLEDDYELATARNGNECLGQLRRFGPDLVLLDIMMPEMDGYETCRRIKDAPGGELIPVIFVSGKGDTTSRLVGYEAGADDYLIKPFDHDELLAKVRVQFRLRQSLLKLAATQAKLTLRTSDLENAVQERTAEVVATRDITVFALAKLAESRDPETGEHLERMRAYSQILAEELAKDSPYAEEIDEAFLENLYRSSPLHDIGKVGIPDVILLKPGRLSDQEFEIMKRHATIGTEALLSATGHKNAGGGFLAMGAEIAAGHHERYNGSGYPRGLAGLEIPLAARIVALADVYDALTSVRVYKAAFEPEIARAMIEQEEGQHFDPVVVQAFRTGWERFLAVPDAIKEGQLEFSTAPTAP